MGFASVSAAIAALLAILTYLRLDSLPMPFPCSDLPIGPVDPAKLPRPVPVEGFAPLSLLAGGDASPPSPVVRLFEGRVVGSESVAVSPDGSGDLVMCDRYGYVWRATRNEKSSDGRGPYVLEEEPLAHLGAGRPLGFHFDAKGNLLVCVSGSGLVMVEAGAFSRDKRERERAKVVLLTAAVSTEDKKHSPILYANDLDVSKKSGIVYFTDSVAIPPARNRLGFWDTMQSYVLSLAQGESTGRLLSYDPKTRKTEVVSDGLWFANGVALSPDESWAAVVETNTLRVHRVHLEGAKRGQREVLLDGLPGYPDGITRAFDVRKEQDGFWLALVAPPQPVALKLLRTRLGRLLMAWTPEKARPPFVSWGSAVRLRASDSGVDVVGWLLDPKGEAVSSTSAVTDAAEHGDESGRLFFGNLAGNYVSFVDGASARVDAAAAAAEAAKENEGGGGGDRSEL